MAVSPVYEHLSSARDLETTRSGTRAIHAMIEVEKRHRAVPLVAQARALKASASQAKTPMDLLNLPDIQPALLAAAGLSDKAVTHLMPEDKTEAIQGLIRNFLEPAHGNFVEELVFRFLLTRGDTLGGSMRNIGGVLAQRKLTRAIISTLRVAGKKYYWLHSVNNTWSPMRDDDPDVELYLRGLSWQRGNQTRILNYNLTVPLVKNNVDFSLINSQPTELSPATYKSPNVYIAFGELKGGIDPAGADEHWKTARTALNRIQKAFSQLKLHPHTFFIGAAIEKNGERYLE